MNVITIQAQCPIFQSSFVREDSRGVEIGEISNNGDTQTPTHIIVSHTKLLVCLLETSHSKCGKSSSIIRLET